MDILSLLIFIVFIVIPIVNSVIQRIRGGAAQQQPPAPQNRPTGRPGTGPANTRPAGTRPAGTGQSGERDDDLSRRIEEARRRVREAAEREGTQRGSSRRPNPQPDPNRPDTTTTLFRDDGSAARPSASQSTSAQGRPSSPGAFLPREGETAQPSYGAERRRDFGDAAQQSQQQAFLPSDSETARSTYSSLQSERKQLDSAPAMRVQRGRTAQSGTLLEEGKLLTFDRRSLLRGYVWHEILSEPRSKKRRKLSRR